MKAQSYKIGYNGSWNDVVSTHVGKNNSWVQGKIKFVAKDGKWIEVNSNVAVSTDLLIELTQLSYRAGAPLQSNLISNITTFDGEPSPKTGAFYMHTTNVTDRLGNFSSLVLQGDTPLSRIDETGGASFIFDKTQHQYLRVPISTDAPGYYDLLGVIGNNGAKYWEIGCKVNPTTLPTPGVKSFVFFSGDSFSNISVYYLSDGSLNARFRHGAYSRVLTVVGVAAAQQWFGFVFRHRLSGTTRFLELETSNGQTVTLEADIVIPLSGISNKVFNYWTPPVDQPINIGYGGYSDPGAAKLFNSKNTHSVITIDSLGTTLTNTTTTYRSAKTFEVMPVNTGKYYVEFENNTSYDVIFGLAEQAAAIDVAPAVVGWTMNTINGRRANHQTGAPTTWAGAQVIAANSIVGVLYDSDVGSMTTYVNGVSRNGPWVAGSVTVPVCFIIGGRAATASTNPFNIKVRRNISEWTNAPTGVLQELPLPDYPLEAFSWIDAKLRDLYIRNEALVSPLLTKALYTANLKIIQEWKNLSTLDVTVIDTNFEKINPDNVISSVPSLPEGNYEVKIGYQNVSLSTPMFFTIKNKVQRQTPLSVNFSTDSYTNINNSLMAAHKKWGGTNGGVVSQNVKLFEGKPCKIYALGDTYNGPVKGVDKFGNPSGFNTRIGGCLVTRDYFGPGSFRALIKPTRLSGAVNAIWSFHYEEASSLSELFPTLIAEGLHGVTDIDNYTYVVRNHEIDVEFPTALKTNANQTDVSFTNARFNTWIGELRNYDAPNNDAVISDPMYNPVNDPAYWSEFTDKFVNHGVSLDDGLFHEIRFDWHLGPNARVEFYIDGVLIQTNTTHVPDIPMRLWLGVWFPNSWAGPQANWNEQTMEVKSISITPFIDQQSYTRIITESFPNDTFRDILKI